MGNPTHRTKKQRERATKIAKEAEKKPRHERTKEEEQERVNRVKRLHRSKEKRGIDHKSKVRKIQTLEGKEKEQAIKKLSEKNVSRQTTKTIVVGSQVPKEHQVMLLQVAYENGFTGVSKFLAFIIKEIYEGRLIVENQTIMLKSALIQPDKETPKLSKDFLLEGLPNDDIQSQGHKVRTTYRTSNGDKKFVRRKRKKLPPKNV